MTPAGVILAGGRATRMGGGDKGLLEIGGRSVLSRVIEKLRPNVGDLALNANGDPARFDCYGLPVIADSVAGHPGPLAGVLAGLDWAAERGVTHIVTAAADTPFFPSDLVARLLAARPLALAATEHPTRGPLRQPTFGLWPVALRHDLRDALQEGVRKVVIWTEKHGAETVVFPTCEVDPFFNVNTPEDLEAANRLAALVE